MTATPTPYQLDQLDLDRLRSQGRMCVTTSVARSAVPAVWRELDDLGLISLRFQAGDGYFASALPSTPED